MTKKHQYFSIVFAIILLLSLSISFAFALEIKPTDYPNIPFAPTITENSDLPQYASYFFALGIYLAGALAVISLVIGGIQLIFSSVSPEARSNAIDRIKNAILGLMLTLSSFIILQTINPNLTTIKLTPLVAGTGIFYTNGIDEKPAPKNAEPDTSSIPAGYETIIYKCAGSGAGQGPVLLIWKFPEKNFGRYKEATMERKKCGETTSVNTPSFKTSFEAPGVYYFTGTGCNGFMSQAHFSNTPNIEEPFKSEMKSVQIINDTKNNIRYGVILHKEINFRGDCSLPYEANQIERICLNIPSDIPSPMSSANIFMLNKDKPETSGNGAVFYSKPFGYKTGANSGYFALSPSNIGTFWRSKPDKIDFSDSYNYINVSEEEKNLCGNFENCSGSIQIQGNYLSVLYAKQPQSQSPYYCQVFDKDVPNLKEEEVIAVQGRKLDLIYVIPIK